MTGQERNQLAAQLSALSVFRGILSSKPMAALLDFLKCGGEVWEIMDRYGLFVAELADADYCFSDFLCRAVYEDENPYIVSAAAGKEIPPVLRKNAQNELQLLSRLTTLNAELLLKGLDYEGYVPEFANQEVDLAASYAQRLTQIGRYGYGVVASAPMFRVVDEQILPVRTADPIALTDFVGYEEERRQVFENTRALVENRPAANVLLFGDAGTGKSSTVKACANYFYDQGVRLIELRKDQLFSLSAVMGRIANNPLKFIIFIDDLSFNKNDDCFSMLKAALEGSASAKASNAVIYATSNRRHIVKEKFTDRNGIDDVHHSDTVQELLSLSDRFGLTVYFSKPNKQLYLQIVHALAQSRGIDVEESQLNIKAEAFALAKGSRSPRAAEQFINSLL